jgi:DNA polymerase III alpha subunit
MIKPNRFVSIHNHTGFSPFDGLGYPSDHFEFCIQNGLDAHAITEHGQMNSYAHAQLWVEEYNKKNDKKFKYLPGVEAYFHPDLEQWALDKQLADDARVDKKAQKKLREQQEKLQTKIVETTDSSDDTESIEMTNALTIENENETKGSKHFNPVNRRHHLVILPKTSRALQKLFGLVSKSYLRGFYRFPRIDSRMLREASQEACGELLVSSACLGGTVMYTVFQVLQELKLDKIDHTLLDDPSVLSRVMSALDNDYDRMTSCVGRENYYLELQFNKLPAQNLLNRSIIEFAKRHSLEDKLVVTCDAHYYNPDVWKERELYKRLGFMNYQEYSPDNLPKSKEDLKCELFPKNAEQIWHAYLTSKQDTSFYDDQLVCDAIERTHDIAHQVIDDVSPDRSPKYAYKKLVPNDTKSFNYLVKLCKQAMKKKGLVDKEEYVARLKEELDVIKKMGNADYFISYAKIISLAREVALLGPARGCFVPESKVLTSQDELVEIQQIQLGDFVKDAFGVSQKVLATFSYEIEEDILELEFENGVKIRCTKDHRFLTKNRGWVEAQYLEDDDDLVEVV